MRPRTFILLILVLLVGALAIGLIYLRNTSEDDITTTPDDTPVTSPSEPVGAQEPGIPPPEPTPALDTVVVATLRLPVGTRITRELITTERRPRTNIAIQGGYTFTDPDELVGQIVKVEVDRGQAILRPMLALNPSDLAAFGSDLSLYIDQGRVAVAFPMDQYSGSAFAMRPGDLVDVLMSLSLVQLDLEFQSQLPNVIERVNEADLLLGSPFLFPRTLEGRLELIQPLTLVGEVAPGNIATEAAAQGGDNSTDSPQIPRRVTQLTIQQAEVLWVGTYRDPREQQVDPLAGTGATIGGETAAAQPLPTPTPFPGSNREITPDVLILSMPVQDALVLKWATEVGIQVHLALRAQGDTTVFNTIGVTLPTLVDQGLIAPPEPMEFGLEPRANEVPPPVLPEVTPQG
jgi:Flp pilus assembly protein CpaB